MGEENHGQQDMFSQGQLDALKAMIADAINNLSPTSAGSSSNNKQRCYDILYSLLIIF